MVKFFKNNLQSIFTVILMILFISDTNYLSNNTNINYYRDDYKKQEIIIH